MVRNLTIEECEQLTEEALKLTTAKEVRDLVVSQSQAVWSKFLGDGVLAYFGWPRAHEDEAERAVRAARDALSAVRAIASSQALSGLETLGLRTYYQQGFSDEVKALLRQSPHLQGCKISL